MRNKDLTVYYENIGSRLELLESVLIDVWCDQEKYIEVDRQALEDARSWFGVSRVEEP